MTANLLFRYGVGLTSAYLFTRVAAPTADARITAIATTTLPVIYDYLFSFLNKSYDLQIIKISQDKSKSKNEHAILKKISCHKYDFYSATLFLFLKLTLSIISKNNSKVLPRSFELQGIAELSNITSFIFSPINSLVFNKRSTNLSEMIVRNGFPNIRSYIQKKISEINQNIFEFTIQSLCFYLVLKYVFKLSNSLILASIFQSVHLTLSTIINLPAHHLRQSFDKPSNDEDIIIQNFTHSLNALTGLSSYIATHFLFQRYQKNLTSISSTIGILALGCYIVYPIPPAIALLISKVSPKLYCKI